MPKGKTVGTPTKKKAQPYMAKTEKGTVGVASSTRKLPKKGATPSAPFGGKGKSPRPGAIPRGEISAKLPKRMPKTFTQKAVSAAKSVKKMPKSRTAKKVQY